MSGLRVEPPSPSPRADQIVVDLSEVTFMDSSGLGLFLDFTARGTALSIASPSDNVRRVIETTGVAGTLRMQR